MTPGFRSASSIIRGLSQDGREQLKEVLRAPASDVSALVGALLNEDRIQSMVRHASKNILTALRTWVINRGIWRESRGTSPLRAGIQELAEQGWVFEASYGPQWRVSVMPWDIMPRILPLLWEVPWDTLVGQGPERKPAPSPLWSPLMHDIFQCLAFARIEPLLLTNQHTVYRRLANKLDKFLWDRPHVARDVMVGYLLSELDQMGLLQAVGQPYRYEVSERALEFFNHGPKDAFEYLADFIFDPSRLGWPALLWGSLASLIEPGQTLKLVEMLSWMTAIGVGGADSRYAFNQAVQDLLIFDIWEIPGDNTGRLTAWAYAAFRGQFESPEPRTSLVQPTGEIIIPPTVPMDERWQIDNLASRVKSDRVSTYRIDQAAVHRGIRQGLTAESHADKLEKLMRNPLPDNVRVNLGDWYRQYGRHRIIEATLIHSQDAEDSRQMEVALGNDALSRLSPTDIVIPANRVKEIVKRLDRAGSPILSDVLKLSEPAPDQRSTAQPQSDSPWPVRLPGTPAANLNVDDLKAVITEATRRGQYLSLTFQPAGESQARTETIMPVTVEQHWAQVYVISQRRYVLVGWQQILSAQLISSPV